MGTTRVLIGLLLLATVGCGGDTLTSPTLSNLSGTWQGTMNLGGTQTQRLRLSLFQRDTELTGTWAVGTQGDIGGSLGGQVSGSTLSITLREEPASSCVLNITASATESKMTGTYAAANCGFSAAGSLDLTKQ